MPALPKLVSAETQAENQYFPMRLSPSGARSLLFANFWAALLHVPLRCAGRPARTDYGRMFGWRWHCCFHYLFPPLNATSCSWVGLADPFDSALGFAVLVLATEAVALPDLTPRQVSRFLAAVSAAMLCMSELSAAALSMCARARGGACVIAAVLKCGAYLALSTARATLAFMA